MIFFRNAIIIGIVGFVLTLLLKHFGERSEHYVRDFYRSEICLCDTLRPNYFTDSKGIPVVNYYSTPGIHVGVQRNPVEVCQYGLRYYEAFLSGNSEKKQFFLNCADWLVANATYTDSFAFYYYNYPKPDYAVFPPWLSAMTQGMALRVLVNAHRVTNNQTYLSCAKKCLNTFILPVDSGGITYKSSFGWWYEEYAHSKSVKPKVLNGFMHALIGIQQYHSYIKDSLSAFLFSKGIQSLVYELPKYDAGNGYSWYDALKSEANKTYHAVHLLQLNQLFRETNNPIFEVYHTKWGKRKEDNYIIKTWKKPNQAAYFIFLLSLMLFVGISALLIKYANHLGSVKK